MSNKEANKTQDKSSESPAIIGQSIHYSGPMPLPEHLKGYEDVLPGSAERILKMAENQSAHRISIENKVVDSQIKMQERGQIFGTVLGIVETLTTLAAFYYGESDFTGPITLLSAMALHFGYAIYNSKLRKEELQNKQ